MQRVMCTAVTVAAACMAWQPNQDRECGVWRIARGAIAGELAVDFGAACERRLF